MTQTAPEVKFRKDYTVPSFLVDTLDLDFQLNEDVTTVRATMVLSRNIDSADHAAPLVLDGEGLELVEVKVDGATLPATQYRTDDETLTVDGLPERCTLETVVRIKPQDNTRLEGLYKAGPNYCTQCEAEGFRRITYFFDRPDVMAKYTTRIEADKSRYPILLSNGNKVGSGDAEGGRHWAQWEDPYKKPSYLFALVAGDLACHAGDFTTASGRKVALEIYVEHKNIDKCEHALVSLQKSMKWDEEVFGLEYDLDQYMIVAVDDFNMGAMENKGLNVFNSKFVLAKPETATDGDYQGIEGVIAHEYFHNWTGNRVTCRDWFQLSLKEGLTVFRDQQFSGDMNSTPVQRISDVRMLRTHQFAEDSGPMAHAIRPDSYIEMNNFYTVTVYEKGAEVVRMYHTLLGAHGFRKGMDLYFERHDGSAVTCDDFRSAMADANSRDLSQFENWYLQAGTPVVEITTSYDAAAKTYTLDVRQSCPATPGQDEKQPYHMPFAVGLIGKDGKDLPLRLEGEARATAGTRVLELKDAHQRFDFVEIDEEPVPSLNRNFSAPIKLVHERPASDYGFLMAHDSDAFNRWDAGQNYGTQLLLDLTARVQRGEALELDANYIAAFGKVLNDASLDGSYKAQALILPGEGWLCEQMEVADPVAVHTARNFARKALATALRSDLEKAYKANVIDGEYSIDGESVGKRSVKNVCLAYLSTLDGGESLADEQFGSANNMTDSIAALSQLVDSDGPARESALASFYERWKDDNLVIDKWFSVQATADRSTVLAEVEALLSHPDFTLKTPNRVRSLVGTFCGGNPAHFHAADGGGYRFLADRVIELNSINPQVASRMITPLLRWRRYDAARQDLMKSQLERIAGTPELSKDVYEKVSKALEG
jgi:aminopeptidase N